ncbi:MAG: amidohydrolase [Pseudomonadales bacterium]|nr:amidohydrolase [Pseudomonadales bacterium]MDP6970529.1 amidohydrolase [Pseudomonadales bacterium]
MRDTSHTRPSVRRMLVGVSWFCAALTHAAPEDGGLDLLLVNAQVYTPDGWMQAMAVRDGLIVALGSNAAVEKLVEHGTEVLDLKQQAVFPGLHDSHVHPMFAGLEQNSCGFPAGASRQIITAAVAECANRAQAGEWIVGGNWVGAVFGEGEQNSTFLDAVAPDNPVALTDEAHHSLWVNSRALLLAGISADTPDPQGGRIDRDAQGEPTGVLRESAERLVRAVIPAPSLNVRRQALVWASQEMLSYGITSYTVASVRRGDLEPLSALSAEGLIRQRVRGCIVWSPPGNELSALSEQLIEKRHRYAQPRFRPDCVKIFMDGVPTESHTGAMLQPYEGTAERGMLLIPQAVLEEAVARFDRQGLHIKFHAAGDGAVRAAIDAVAAARARNGFGGPIHHVGHSTFVDSADIPRAITAQLGWEFSPYIWYPTPMAAVDVRRAVGDERMRRWVPIRDAIDTGALVVVGSDWSVVPSVNPWLAMETLVTRQMPGGSERALGENQRITLREAFELFTGNGARMMGHRNEVGSLEPGMRADFFVTRTNPFDVPITSLHEMRITSTWIDGEQVYSAQ